MSHFRYRSNNLITLLRLFLKCESGPRSRRAIEYNWRNIWYILRIKFNGPTPSCPGEAGRLGLRRAFEIGALIILLTSACSSNFDYTPPPGSTETAITHYSFGNMEIGGITYTSDLVILPGGEVREWSFDPSTHEITPNDLSSFLSDRVKTIIIGAGNIGAAKLSGSAEDTIEELKSKGIVVHILKSAKAAKLYNDSSKEGLIAFFHLNC